MSDLIRAAGEWPTNAALIADVARLGYLQLDWQTLDPTYGQGNWWTVWRPNYLVTSDLHKGDVAHDDFRQLPHCDDSFDVVAYDPPYVCPGGKTTSTIKGMHQAYGMAGTDFRTPAELQEIINAGLDEADRVARRYILCKCKDYVWSGKLWLGTHHTLTKALELGLECVERFEHVGEPGPQSQKRQVHARRNLSTLFVFKVSSRARSAATLL